MPSTRPTRTPRRTTGSPTPSPPTVRNRAVYTASVRPRWAPESHSAREAHPFAPPARRAGGVLGLGPHQVSDRQRLAHPFRDVLVREVAPPQAERDVVEHGQRIE